MQILKIVYNVVLDSLFPKSRAELESLSYSPEEAWGKLPHAPEPPLANAFSIFAYKDERVSKLVWNIKYKESKQAVAIGGYALFQWFTNRPMEKIILVPIPITQKRRNERGYNQCELLVDEMKRLYTTGQVSFAGTFGAGTVLPTAPTHSPHEPLIAPLRLGSWGEVSASLQDCSRPNVESGKFTICKDLLERVQHLSRQTLKNREDRLESAKGIFAVNEEVIQKLSIGNSEITNTTIIVIDDVITTGSTMKEAMTTLKNAGFKNVFGLSLAH